MMAKREILVEWCKRYAFSLSGAVRDRVPGDQDYLPDTVARSLAQYGLVKIIDDGEVERATVRWICDDVYPDDACHVLIEKTTGDIDEYPEAMARALRDAGKVEILTGGHDGRDCHG